MITYVDSPFQLLQCYELDKLGHSLSNIYVRLNGKTANDEQLINLISILGIKKVKKIRIERIHQKIFHYVYFVFLSLFHRNVIVGDANSFIFKVLSFFYKKEKFILLDDGVATLSNKYVNKHFKRFTIFPEYVKTYINNDFYNLKKLINSNVYSEKKHIIVGAKFVDAGICDQETYITALRKIIKTFDVKDCLYIPHRGESDSEVKAIEDNLSLNILKINLPIELVSLEAKIYPLSISHTLSTAVFSMRKIYDAPIYTFKIPSKNLIQRKEAIEELYKITKSEQFSTFIN